MDFPATHEFHRLCTSFWCKKPRTSFSSLAWCMNLCKLLEFPNLNDQGFSIVCGAPPLSDYLNDQGILGEAPSPDQIGVRKSCWRQQQQQQQQQPRRIAERAQPQPISYLSWYWLFSAGFNCLSCRQFQSDYGTCTAFGFAAVVKNMLDHFLTKSSPKSSRNPKPSTQKLPIRIPQDALLETPKNMQNVLAVWNGLFSPKNFKYLEWRVSWTL